MDVLTVLGLPVGVRDQLLATGNSQFEVNGSGTSRLSITATGPRRLITTRDEFVDFLKTVSFVSDDQAPYIPRTITVVVQEFPIETSPPSLPAVVPVTVTPVNDRPVIVGIQRLRANLTNYIPVSSNDGFNVSFLLNEADVMDVDRESPEAPDFIGLAITGYTGNDSGSWMVWENGTWLPLSSVSDCNPALVSPDGRIRFLPYPDPLKADTQVSIVYRAWDGSEVIGCVDINSDQSPLSAENETFTYDVEYLNRIPLVLQGFHALPSIKEDTVSGGMAVSNITAIVGYDTDDLYLGLAIVGVESVGGVWQYLNRGNWTAFPSSLSSQQALLLASDVHIRFFPSRDYFGNASFSALLWDMSGSDTNTTISDPNTGPFSTEPVTISITVEAVNDEPVVELGVEVVEYTEEGPAIQLFRNITISDIDSAELAWALVTLRCSLCEQEDRASGEAAGLGSGSSLPSNSTDVLFTRHVPPNFLTTVGRSDSMLTELRVLAVVGTDNSPEEFARYLESLYFTSVSREPSSASREVSLVVSDGLDESDPASLTITINLINDEIPLVYLPYSSITWVEDSGPLLLLSSIEITDPDSNSLSQLTWATLELRNHDPTYERLETNCSLLRLNCSFEANVLTLEGPLDIDTYQQALSEVYYVNTNPEPTYHPREVYITVFDGIFHSSAVLLVIEVELINDQLPVVQLAQQVVVFQEPETNPITTRVRVAPGATITDSDLGGFLLHSATLTITDPQDNENEGLILPQETPQINISYSGPYEHSLTLSYEGGVPLIILQDALQVVEYFNTAEQMYPVNRTISITVNDNLTLSGVQMSDPVEVTVVYIPVDDPPEVILEGRTLFYSEGQDPELLHVATDAEIVDVDNDEILGLEIHLTAGSIDTSEESIQVNLTGFESLVTQLPGNSSTFISLIGNASTGDYTMIVRTLSYQHMETPGDPDTGERTITITPLSLLGEPGISDNVTVLFSAVNNAPVIELNNRVFFQEESPSPVVLTGPGVRITDVDSDVFTYMNITLLNALDGELEYISVNGSIENSLDVEWETSDVIVLHGQPSPISEFEAVLSTLTYHNLADEPNVTLHRIVSVEVSDGESSGFADIEVVIIPQNDPPYLLLNNTVVVYVEEQSVAIAAAVQVFDPDSLLVEYRVRPTTLFPDDVISGPELQELNGIYVASLTPPKSPEEVAEILTHVIFTSNSSEPNTNEREFCISVRDEGMAPSTEECVTVEVVAVNDNPPQFTESSYLVQVQENLPNALVTQIDATDADSVNSNVTLVYSITAGDDCYPVPLESGLGSGEMGPLLPVEGPPCRFEINSLTGELSTTSAAPDREERDNYTLTVTVFDGKFSVSTEVVVVIDDVNDVAPLFVPAYYEVTIPVGVQEGYPIVQLTVIDPDLNNEFSFILISMEPNIGREVFVLDPDVPGQVILNRPERELDPSVSQYTLVFEAIDSYPPFLDSSNLATVVVNITQNQEPPAFEMTSYTAMVSEAASDGTGVLTVTATDGDPGYHGEFTFSIFNQAVPFAVDPQTGEVTVTDSSQLDFETVQEYIFSVVATDTGRPPMSSSVEVRVLVVNVNDNSPTFGVDRHEVEICEGAPVGYVITELLAEDADGDTLNYDLIEMSGCSGCIVFNSSTGELTVASEIDFEEQQLISFSILVTDGIDFADVVVSVSVLNDNEEAPQFEFEYLTIEIPETQEVGSLLPFPMDFIPLASDTDSCNIDQCDSTAIISNETCDIGSGLQYSITSGNEEGLFEINPSNGLISVSQNLDFDTEAHQEFNLNLTVWDGQLADTAHLTIIVTDINDNLPEFQNDTYSVTIPEDTPVGTLIITTLATDMDPTDRLQYSLISEINSNHFTINENGEVAVSAPLDFESIPQYDLIVAVTDRPSIANATAVLALLTVYINDVNDIVPQFTEEEYRFTTLENLPPGPVGTVLALDQDPANVTLLYSILSSTPDDDAFFIDSETGLLQSTVSFDRENQSIYILIVQVTDNGSPPLSSSAQVTLEIEDVNESPPVFSNDTPSAVSVSESTQLNTILLTLEAFDSDNTENSALGFRIVNGDNSSTFSLSPLGEQTVQLILSEDLDYETVMQYELVVEVFDMANIPGGMSLSSRTEITVIVTDENDNPPVFIETMYSAEIPELSPSGTSVLQVQAIDIDSNLNAVIVYSILNASSPFSIHPTTGVITVEDSESLDIVSNGRQFTLTIGASNPNTTLQGSTTVVVYLLDVNNNAPFFTLSEFTFTIEEDFTPVSQVGLDEGSGDVLFYSSGLGSGQVLRQVSTITAFDLDEGVNAELRYSLADGSERFFIHPITGNLFVSGLLDREQQETHAIDVHVTDLGSPALENSTTLLLIVIDINDNGPVFQPESYSAAILENQPPGIDVLQLFASDVDIGQNITFSIVESNVPFQVIPQVGLIQTVQLLDREEQESWSFQVEATDGEFTSTADITISVEDENDNPPTISPSLVTTNITENAANGTVIAIFDILDNDLDVNAESVISVTDAHLFSIDNSGILRVAGPIDYEMIQDINLEILVRNVAPPHFTASAQVMIGVENENDNPPIVRFGQSSVQYDELIARRVSLDVDISISDADGEEVTRLIDGTIQFVSDRFLEPSFAYEPLTGGDIVPEFQCSLEVNKFLKFSSCGIPDVTVLSRYTQDVLLLHGGLTVTENVVGDSIVFDSSQNQYATYIGNVGTLDSNGLTISTWIWLESTPSSVSQAIMSKISSSQLLYGVFCNPDGSLEFHFTSNSSAHNVNFPGGCSMLKSAWHHLGVVVDNRDLSQWRLHVFIDGEEFGSAAIPQPFDSTGGFLVGASRANSNSPIVNFFNGRLHMLAISRSSSDLNSLNCVTGCGLVLISLHVSPLTHYYNYSQRALIVEGSQPIGAYEEFLNSLSLVLPFTEPRVSEYRLSYTVQDTIFNCLPQVLLISVIPSNDFQPELSLNGDISRDYSTVFVEEAGPVALVNTTTFYLTDMDLIEFEYVVVARVIDPLQPHTEEVLAVQNVPEGMNVSYSSDHTLELTGLLPLPLFESVLRTLTYDNRADEPEGDTRQVVITVSDPPMTDVSALTNVSITNVNDPPELVMVSTLAEYSEGDGPVPILESATITDSDNAFLVSATITLTPLDPGMETLSANSTNTAITTTYNSTSATLTLTGVDTLENYTTVLLSITYEHSGSADPTLGTRIFSFVLSDGEIEAEPQVVMLFFAAVNDAPMVDLNGGSSAGLNYRVDFVEDADEEVAIVSPDAIILDVDSDNLVSLSINLTNPQQDYERIVIPPVGSVDIEVRSVSDDFVQLYPGSGVSSPLSEFVAVLRTVQYQNTAEEPAPGVRIIRFLASDGEDYSLPALTEVNVIPVNDRPELDLDTSTVGTGFVAEGFEEGGNAVYITGRSVSLRDNDVNAVVEMVTIAIQGAVDGLSEIIESTDPNVTLPLPANGQSVTYMIDFSGEELANVVTLLMSLQYRNTRLEPTPGTRVITVATSDGMEFSNTAVVTLQVMGVNENTPQFTMTTYTFMINESLPILTPVGSVTAVDIDDGRDGDITYEIVTSDPAEGLEDFTINGTTGEVFTAVPLDWEAIRSYELIVSAKDSGLPQRTANATVTVVVGDINDNSPVFSPENNFNFTVLESRRDGDVVETVLVSDADSGMDVIFIELLNTDEVPFSVGVADGEIRVDGDLDLDTQSPEGCISDVSYDLILKATDFFNTSLSSTAVFTANVVDVNDNEPQFVSESTFTAVENNRDLYLFSVLATDRDCTSNGEITYTFPNSSTQALFTIDQSTGDVYSLAPLDREEREFYEIHVLATDGGVSRHTTSALLTLQVLDLNDNPPVFSELQYEVTIREDVSQRLVNVIASDIDRGTNGTVASYYLDPSTVPIDPLTNSPLFTIDPFSRDIHYSLVPSSDYEFESNVRLTVLAEDAGSPPLTGSTIVIIYVIDVNDNPPQFLVSSTQAEVPENEPGILVTTFSANDVDSGSNGEVFFRLLNNNDVFAINSTTGDLFTINGLDFEDECYYLLTVEAYDGGTPSLNSSLNFEVFVQPVEDLPPVFTLDTQQVRISLPENTPVGSVVIQVTAEDGDRTECDVLGGAGSGSGSSLESESQLVYSFSAPSQVFMINEATGEISLLQSVDYEETQQYTLTVLATDSANFQAQAVVTIDILDRNDNSPQFQQPLYEASVPENSAVGSSILEVSATDADSLDQGRLLYSLTNNPPYLSIGTTDGVLYVAGDIDFESGSSVVTFSAVVTDAASNTDSVSVTITIVDVNDLPPVINTPPQTLVFTEGQVSLFPFPVMNISDPDSSQHLCSANVTLASPELANVGPVEQCVCTNASNCTSGCFEFLQLSADSFPGSVQQLQEGFQLVLQGNFSIQDYERALESVQYVNIIFNPEPQTRTVSVTVVDCQLPSNTLIQSITIQPLNTVPPVLDLNGDDPGINYQTTFMERGSAISIVSDNVSISDEDTADEDQVLTSIDIRLTNHQGDQESIYVAPGSQLPGDISVSGNSTHLTLSGMASLEDYTDSLTSLRYINLASEPTPTLRIVEFIAHEFFLSSVRAYTSITIATINDFPPTVIADPPHVNYITTYTEGASGVDIVDSDAVINDEDSTNDNVTELQVYVLSPTSHDRLFVTDTTSISPSIVFDQTSDSSLSFTGSAPHSDYEAILRNIQYQFTGDEFASLFPPRVVFIQIADHSLSGFTAIQVRLYPINDHLPEFTEDNITLYIPENATVGASIYQVQYTDMDTFSPSEVNFRIINGSMLFSISPESGVITLEGSLDYETTEVHRFTVELTDEGLVNSANSVYVEVTVIVVDQNDHVPIFTQETYNATVNEGAPIGTSVLQVAANDRDSPIHSILIFTTLNTTDFTIDSNGTLYTNTDLDQEVTSSYQFLVTVQNPGDIARDTAEIYITVLDVNDHSPFITLSPDSALLQEPHPRLSLSSSLTITDRDSSPSLDYGRVEILENAPGVLIATLHLPGINVVGNGTNSLTFSGVSESLTNYEQVLRGVIYEDTTEEPLPIIREIAYQVGSDPGLLLALNFTPSETISNIAVFQVSVELINDQVPVIQLDTRDLANLTLILPECTAEGSYSTVFTEDDPPVLLSHNSLSITDADSGDTTIHWASVKLAQAPDGELESLHYSGPIAINTSASSNTQLLLQGPASIAEFEAALHTVAYQSLSQDPMGSTRQVEFTVSDGLLTSSPALACISLFEVNDPPVVTLGPNGTVDIMLMYTEGQTEELLVGEELHITGRVVIVNNHLYCHPIPIPFYRQ